MLVFLGMVHEIQYLHCGMGTFFTLLLKALIFRGFLLLVSGRVFGLLLVFLEVYISPLMEAVFFYSRGCFLRW